MRAVIVWAAFFATGASSLAPGSAHAEIVYWFGDPMPVAAPPPRIAAGTIVSSGVVVFDEAQMFTSRAVDFPADFRGPGRHDTPSDETCGLRVPIGGALDSHYLHFDDGDDPSDTTGRTGWVFFSGPILGVMGSQACLEGSDGEFNVVTTFESSDIRPVSFPEGDVVVILPSNRGLWFRFNETNEPDWDGLRVITASPGDLAGADLGLECAITGPMLPPVGNTFELRLTLSSVGSATLGLPSVDVVLPNSVSFVAGSGGSCAPWTPMGGVLTCAVPTPPTAGGDQTITITLRVDAPVTPVGFMGFASTERGESAYDNNHCFFIASGDYGDAGISPADGGLVPAPDGGSPQLDGSFAMDGAASGYPPGALASFSGGGGCACSATPHHALGGLAPMGGVAFVGLVGLAMRRRQRYSSSCT